MSRPAIFSITPSDNFNAFPISKNIEILFDKEINEFLAENSIVLIGPNQLSFVGTEFEEKIFNYTQEAKFPNALETFDREGQVPINFYLYKVNSDGDILEDQDSYEEDSQAYSKLVIEPRIALQEKTAYRLLVGGQGEEPQIGVGTKSVYTPLKDPLSLGEGILRAHGIWDEDDEIVVTVTKAGSSSTCQMSWFLSSDDEKVYTLLPQHGRNLLFPDKHIYLELLGGNADSFKAGDQWTIKLLPVEYMEETYKLDFKTAAEEIKELPKTVSQSPVAIVPPSQAEILAGENQFLLTKIVPEYSASNISLNTRQVILTFSKNIDPNSVNANTIRIYRESMEFQDDNIEVPFSWIVAGNKIYINLTREQRDA
jgi:hypothetical protein